MARIRLSQEFFLAAMKTDTVRSALAKRADLIADRARSMTEAEGVTGEVTRIDGIRPKGRSYSRIIHSNGAQEHGTAYEARKRILGSSR